MHRLPIVLRVFVCALVCMGGLSSVAAGRDDDADVRPNIVLVIVDDLGWADLSPNNSGTFYETPSFESFARTAARFERGYAASPVCSPTRASIMAGINPVLDGTTEWFWDRPGRSARFLSADRINSLPNDRPTIAEYLRASGYETFFAGKWHLGDFGRHRPQNRGYEVNIGGTGRGGPGKGGFFAPYPDWMGIDGPEGEYLPERLTAETIDWIARRDGGRPFFATLSFYTVHTPLEAPAELTAKYAERRDALGHDDDVRFEEVEQVWPVDRVRTRRVIQDHARYAAMVEAMDGQFGRLMGALDELGVSDETVVVVVSDNGGLSTAEGSPTSNLPLRGGKGWLYEGGIRVPFFVRWPGVTDGGVRIDEPVHTSDILPTVLDAAGVAAAGDAEHEGRSLRGVLGGESAPRSLFFHYPHYSNQGGFPGGAVVRGRFKYVLRYEDGRGHLFDVVADPGESADLAGSRPRLAAALRGQLVGWLRRNEARMLVSRGEGEAPWHWRDE